MYLSWSSPPTSIYKYHKTFVIQLQLVREISPRIQSSAITFANFSFCQCSYFLRSSHWLIVQEMKIKLLRFVKRSILLCNNRNSLAFNIWGRILRVSVISMRSDLEEEKPLTYKKWKYRTHDFSANWKCWRYSCVKLDLY